MVFQGRLLLRVISTILMIITIPLMALVALNAPWSDPILAVPIALVIPFPLLVIFFYMMNTAFGYLRVDSEGVFIKTLLGGTLLRWNEIAEIKYSVHLESVYGAQSVEPSITLRLKNGKKKTIPSTYDKSIYSCIAKEAASRELLADS